MVNRPIEYGRLACESMMNKFKPEDLPPKDAFFYHQGVFLSGMQNIYYLTKDKRYFDYVKGYVDAVIGSNGEVYGFDYEATEWNVDISYDGARLKNQALTMLDSKQPVILLYNLYYETGEEKYKKAIETISKSMYFWPVNIYGGYWHMMMQHHQMWLDGAYMAGPLSAMYSKFSGDNRLLNRAVNQIFIMDEHMKNEQTGLYFHGWDPSKEMDWADKKTGLSSESWGRAVGWYAVAIVDILEYLPKGEKNTKRLCEIEKNLLTSLSKFQDEKTGMWYEVLDKPFNSDNWVESSCTNLFIYSYAKAIRMGIISEHYFG